MSSISLVSRPCKLCRRPTALWCGRCENEWYCCKEHSVADWERHKHECIPVQHQNRTTTAPGHRPTTPSHGSHYRPSTPGNSLRIIATPPPSEEQIIHVQAIYFDPQEEQPRIISVRCRPARKGCPTPVVDPYFPKDETPESIVITQGLNGETLRFPLHLWYSGRSLRRGNPVNRAIYNITAGAAKRRWCGPAVVLKFAGARKVNYAEAGSNELPTLSAYFLAFT